jgi:cobalt-zinc-cadmium efflux system outer membrane protein
MARNITTSGKLLYTLLVLLSPFFYLFMYRFYFLLFTISTLSICRSEPALVLSQASLGERIRAQNPDLKAARWKIQEAIGQMNQAGRLARPRLEVQGASAADLRDRNFNVGLTASFPVTNRLRWEKAVGKAEVEAAEMEVRTVEAQLVAAAREQFIKALALKSRRQLIIAQQNQANTFAEQMQKSVERAEASLLDAGQAQLETASFLIEQKQIDAEEIAILTELKKLLGMNPQDAIVVGGELPPVIKASEGNISQRADYQLAVREVRAATQEFGLAQMNRYDDVEAGVFVSGERREDMPGGFRSDFLLGFKLSIPLPFWNDNSGNIQSAEAKVQRRKQEARAISAQASHLANGASAEMEQWKKLLTQISSELLPLAEQQTKLSQDAYQQGQGEIQAIFRAQAQKRKLSLNQLDALREYHLARVRYESATAAKP